LILPPAALAVPGSDPASPDAADPRLICPPQALFDDAACRAALAAALPGQTGTKAVRAEAVRILAAANAQGRAAIAAALTARPFAARQAIRSYAWLADRLIVTVLDVVQTHLHPAPNPTEGERISLIAIGGYGRGEMAPFSDVDLLFLTPWKMTPWAESLIEDMLYILWDLKLKVGHASRTVKDSIRQARDDMTIRTALLEMRPLAGDADLARTLRERLQAELFRQTAPQFIEAKLAERAERHRKQGGQRYVVEPNVKEGKGGLRDLQSLYWIAKYVHGVDDVADLVATGIFRPEEYATFDKAEEFLWAVRCHLHLIAGRAADQLSFDMQVEVAARLGYLDGGGRRAVEHFMQDYFRHATRVGELTRIFLTAQEANHLKPEPMLTRLMSRRRTARAPYAIKQNRLTVADPAAFFADPLKMLEIFEEALRTGTLLHPDAMRLVAASLHLIDQTLRDSPAANQIFLDLMLKHGNPERALRRMNELGVLAAFIPDFEPIVAMMQFNMYHHFTVDEHIIQCISNLSQIERGVLVEELPVASGILKAGVNRRILYVALLLHDIGKGRPEDHSIYGAQVARRLGPRLGLSPKECDTVEWLVRHHLLMSDMAQKRDISEPRTVRDFAKAVQTKDRLDLLTVLTVCDIRGVGPGTWNNWKAMLLRGLYRATETALATGIEAASRELREGEAKRALREALADWPAPDLRAETARHYGPYWQGLPTAAHLVFARLLRGITEEDVRIDLHPDPGHDATRASFAMADHPGLFSRMTGALALVGANVVDARTYTSKDGWATAVFWVQDVEGHPYEERRLPRLRQMILRTLNGEVVARDALKDRDKLKKREQAFRVPTSITFDNEGSEIYTIVEVDTRDRPGLLHDLSRTLANANVYIASAVIATYGEQVVDTFYVKDTFGLKFHAEARQRALEKKLREAIELGAERARG